ncbi:HalOD1 output domain-containing protein [Haloarculaceae archaeon H-GB2-1]|nr:hypothetical protein [Haloarculaceae archaeon H-GB1-1]MEA5388668.1 HalOD1 output domain-containing protein [Haloarculaceae archaeon H-GB11]MEA5406721.1 HalOD1 output domain-containing protein [Haloarculaceae archaeon H-GB2-1]
MTNRKDPDSGRHDEPAHRPFATGRFDPDDDSIVEELVMMISEHTDTDPTALPPLSEYVDPEALDTLVRSFQRDAASGSIAFTYDEYVVKVRADGGLSVERANAEK